MPTAYIALGSNLGNRAHALSSAVSHLSNLGRVVAQSSLYETEPVGYHHQPAFLNAVVALETQLEPLPLLRGLLAIERELGRDRSQGPSKGPRTLDLDLLLMGDWIVADEELSLPHPALATAQVCAGAAGRDCARSFATRKATKPWQTCWPCCPMRARIESPPCAECPQWPSPTGQGSEYRAPWELST